MRFATRMPSAASTRMPALMGSRLGTTSEIPDDFVEILDCLPAQIDRQLGYFGQCRFVAFRYEPRAEDVMWTDERSFGIATGAWQMFHREVSSLADLYNINVGGERQSAEHVLVCDRVKLTAYFAPRDSAESFLAQRRELLPNVA